MNQSLANLYQSGDISYEDAMNHSNDMEELRPMIHGHGGAS